MIRIICTLSADDKPPSKERAFFDFRVNVRQEEGKLSKIFRKGKFVFFLFLLINLLFAIEDTY